LKEGNKKFHNSIKDHLNVQKERKKKENKEKNCPVDRIRSWDVWIKNLSLYRLRYVGLAASD
jgi:hypothetical protein